MSPGEAEMFKCPYLPLGPAASDRMVSKVEVKWLFLCRLLQCVEEKGQGCDQ